MAAVKAFFVYRHVSDFARYDDKKRRDSGTRNRFDAEVQNITDLGEIRELHLKVGRWELRTRVATTTKLVAGQTIAIDIDPKGCTIVNS